MQSVEDEDQRQSGVPLGAAARRPSSSRELALLTNTVGQRADLRLHLHISKFELTDILEWLGGGADLRREKIFETPQKLKKQ